MIRLRTLAASAAVTAGLSAIVSPALADYVRLGSVDVGFKVDRDTTWNRFGGSMEGLRLVADHADIYCRSISVEYGNGQHQKVYSGMLREDRPINVDLAGDRRKVNQINFVCRSDRFSGGRIYISADVGRYRDEWQRSPGWAMYWSHIFHWGPAPGPAPMPGPGSYDPAHWVVMGTESFVGRHDRAARGGGWSGRRVDTVALQPIDNDAVCSSLVATFANGQRQGLNAGQRGVLRRGGFYRFDLPGGNRNIVRLDLTCHAAGDYAVRVKIFARK
jgi:hypothetical protein